MGRYRGWGGSLLWLGAGEGDVHLSGRDRGIQTMAWCKGQGHMRRNSVQVTVGSCAMAQLRGLGMFAVAWSRDRGSCTRAQCRGQGTCNVAQCKGGVTHTVTQHLGRVPGAGAEPPGCLWPLSWPCHGRFSPWGGSQGAVRPWAGAATPRPGPPVLHKDDVVESTTSRPLHTVGTYCEAEPGREGSGQGQVGVWQQQSSPHPDPAGHPTAVGDGCPGSSIPWGWG